MLIPFIVIIGFVVGYIVWLGALKYEHNKVVAERNRVKEKYADKYDEYVNRERDGYMRPDTFDYWIEYSAADRSERKIFGSTAYERMMYSGDHKAIVWIVSITTVIFIIIWLGVVTATHHDYLTVQAEYEYMQEYADMYSDDFLRAGGFDAIKDYNNHIIDARINQSHWYEGICYIDDWNECKLIEFNKE